MSPAVPIPLRVLVVDDHPFFREGLLSWIQRQRGWTGCGFADSLATAEAKITESSPDVVLLDLNLKGEDGLALLPRAAALGCKAAFIVLTQSDDFVQAERAFESGARAFVLKDEATSTLLQAVIAVMRNERYTSPRIAVRLERRQAHATTAVMEPLDALSARERQILAMLGDGRTSKEIAGELGISPKTAEAHRDNLRRKLKLPDAATLLRSATLWRHERRI